MPITISHKGWEKGSLGKVRTEASTSVGGQLIPVVTVGLEVAINLARKPTLVACEQLEQEAFADVEKLRRAHALFQPPLSAKPAAQA